MSRSRSSSPSQPPSGSSGPPGRAGSLRWKAAKFLLLSLLLFVLLFYPWQKAAPAYKKHCLTKGATVLFIRTLAADGSNKTVLYFDDTQEFGFSLNLNGRPMNAKAFKGEIIHYNMVILLALILASPGLGYKRRLKKAVIGALILFAIHCFHLATKIEWGIATQLKALADSPGLDKGLARMLGEYSAAHYSIFKTQVLEIVTQFLDVFGPQVLPFAVWAGLCVPSILKYLRPEEEMPAKAGRGAS